LEPIFGSKNVVIFYLEPELWQLRSSRIEIPSGNGGALSHIIPFNVE
jgi:hypothetical protein